MHQSTNSNPTSNPSPKASVSERKLAANRANAQRSTGPRTPQGKAHAAMNALRHGILARAAFNVAIEGEDRRVEFEALLAGLAQEYQPRTITEEMAIQQLAGCYWKLAKVWRYEQERAYCEWNVYDGSEESRGCNENNALQKLEDSQTAIEDGKTLRKAGLFAPTIPRASANTILRYQGAINTMMTRCLTLLERRRMQRAKSAEELEELDYTNEAVAPAPEKEGPQKPSAPTNDDALHKQTQKASADAKVSAAKEANPTSQAPLASTDKDPDRRDPA